MFYAAALLLSPHPCVGISEVTEMLKTPFRFENFCIIMAQNSHKSRECEILTALDSRVLNAAGGQELPCPCCTPSGFPLVV